MFVLAILALFLSQTELLTTKLPDYEWYNKDSICLFHETIDVEKALLKQVVAALEPQFLKSFRNKTTNVINMSIADVLTRLFTKYARQAWQRWNQS